MTSIFIVWLPVCICSKYEIWLTCSTFHLLNECDNVTDIDIEYHHFECEVSKVIDKHAPV